MNNENIKTNNLINEKSPYLLQHAHNPVDWHPWSEEAFAKAVKEDKPVFLSIGYSTCHWCHVMAHESFEDDEIASIMNQYFISIKVDREERPDIDNIYMTVCQMMTGGGGWPLSVFLTPGKKPFLSGTYFPKEDRYGRIGFKNLLVNVAAAWREKRKDIDESADQITGYLTLSNRPDNASSIDTGVFDFACKSLLNRFDNVHGGFGAAPKFPSPHNFIFLLRHWKHTGKKEALEAVEKTLLEMHKGGMYDQIGFGFHRYSTDKEWLVPHFEKMLYDQAMLMSAYTEAYQATKNEIYKRVIEEIFEYITREMTAPEGGFYSAEDADSEGVEGKYYVWSEDELKHVLSNDDFSIVQKVFSTTGEGNYEVEALRQKNGTNILHRSDSDEVFTKSLGMQVDDFKTTLNRIRKQLLEYRNKRIHPHKDDKILTDWNGLMIAALAKAGRALNAEEMTGSAVKAYSFIETKLTLNDGMLLHRYRDGEALINANLDDYVFMIWASLELYETSFDVKYLKRALQLNSIANKSFHDDINGGYFFTPEQGKDLIARTKGFYDSAIPSGNSVQMMNLIRLARITANTVYEDTAYKLIGYVTDQINDSPSAFRYLITAYLMAESPSTEIIIAGNSSDVKNNDFLQILNNMYLPNKVVLFVAEDSKQELADLASYINDFDRIENKTTAYVCSNYKCSLPAVTIEEFKERLRDSL